MKRVSVRCSSSKAVKFTTMQSIMYLGQTCPRILFSWRKEQADSIISMQIGCCFLINEADICCVELELSVVFKRKSPPSTWHAGAFLLSCFSIAFQQLPCFHKLHTIFSGSLGKRLYFSLSHLGIACLFASCFR